MNNNNFPLQVAIVNITLKLSNPIILLEYPGTSLRGMIKKSLLNNWGKFYLGFDTSEELFWIDAFWKSSHLPRPYGIIVNPLDAQSKTITDTFIFGIALYGNAIQFWRRLIEQIDWWGGHYNPDDKGLWNGNFSVQKVNCRTNGQLLFEKNKFTGISPYELTMSEASSISRYLHFNKSVQLIFNAPLWLRGKDNNRWIEYDKFDLNLFTFKIVSHANRLNRTYTTDTHELGVPSLKDVKVKADCKPVSWAVYSNKAPKEPGQQEFIRGIKGEVILDGNLEELSTLLLFGSWIGAGKGTTQGLGFYQLIETNKQHVLSDNLFEQVITIENLQNAYDEIITDDTDDDYHLENDIDIYQIQSKLKNGQYKPAPLRGAVIPKANGSFRFLAIPNFLDRIVQRAVLQIITPLLEPTFESSSHGYRIARSRYTAARQLNQLRSEGYKYVIDADITKFFDTVKHDILLKKLKDIIQDKKVLSLIENWITADVLFNKNRLKRKFGLPQGMSLSPILANVYLDKFDETIEKHGIKLVRYADDFIMLCRDKNQLVNAKKIAEKALDKIGLKISAKKTKLTSFDEGFDYLGFLFVRSVIVEKEKKNKKKTLLPIDKEDVIAELSRLGYEKVIGRKSTYFNGIQIRSNDSFLRTIWLMTPGSKAFKSMGVYR